MNCFSRIVIILSLFVCIDSAFAVEMRREYQGYIIKLNKDTVPVMLSVPYSGIEKHVNKYRMCDIISIILPDGNEQKIKPEEVLGYSFKEENTWNHYISCDLSKTVDPTSLNRGFSKFSQVKFIKRIIESALILYVYESETPNATYMKGDVIPIGNSDHGVMSNYYINKDQRMFMIPIFEFKKTMLMMTSGNTSLAGKISSKEYKYKDLETIVNEFNKSVQVF